MCFSSDLNIIYQNIVLKGEEEGAELVYLGKRKNKKYNENF